MTHYAPGLARFGVRLSLALCGKVVGLAEHSTRPTCPRCDARLAEDDAEAKALAAKWDQEAAEKRKERTL